MMYEFNLHGIQVDVHGLHDKGSITRIQGAVEKCGVLKGLHIFICRGCGRAFVSDEEIRFEGHDHTEYDCCPECHENLEFCSDCGEPVLTNCWGGEYIRGSLPVCHSCFSENYTTCSDCEEFFHRGSSCGDRCEDCDSNYTACENCEDEIHNDNSWYDEDGGPYCRSCYHERCEEEGEREGLFWVDSNPPVKPGYVEKILAILSRPLPKKGLSRIAGNMEDAHIPEIIEKVGPVQNPIYVYGLIDREEFEFAASSDLLPYAQAILGYGVELQPVPGNKRFGVARKHRDRTLGWVVSIIRGICRDMAENATPSHVDTAIVEYSYPDEVVQVGATWGRTPSWSSTWHIFGFSIEDGVWDEDGFIWPVENAIPEIGLGWATSTVTLTA